VQPGRGQVEWTQTTRDQLDENSFETDVLQRFIRFSRKLLEWAGCKQDHLQEDNEGYLSHPADGLF
jgi:hypothetical protein